MTFAAALIEADIEAACEALGLDEADTGYVIASHRASDGKLMRTMFSHRADYAGYVECRLAIRAGLRGDGVA
jgi:hypothetical protein